MPFPEVPLYTLRSLAMLLRAALIFIHGKARTLLVRTQPPCDLIVSTRSGGRYSGVLVVEDNRIVGGATHLTSSDTPPPPPSRALFESHDEESRPWR